MGEWLEYAAAWLVLKALGALPRPIARATGAAVVALAFQFRPRLRRVAEFNLRLAFPVWTDAERRRVIRGLVRQVGWMAGEFSQFPRYTRQDIERIVMLDGFEKGFKSEKGHRRPVCCCGFRLGDWEEIEV